MSDEDLIGVDAAYVHISSKLNALLNNQSLAPFSSFFNLKKIYCFKDLSGF